MQSAKGISTPSRPTAKLFMHNGLVFEDAALYQSVVVGLQYVSLTQPDISYTVNRVSQFMHVPTFEHWCVVKGILWDLQTTFNHGLLI